jgi:hypothetical protein
MRPWSRYLVMIVLLLVPPAGRCEPLGDPPADAGRFVLFIHAGSDGHVDPKLVKQAAVKLAERGYVVRSPDTQFDEEGPGVDYFSKGDLQAAQDIAAFLNTLLPPRADRSIAPRFQRTKNPPGYIGVWLF